MIPVKIIMMIRKITVFTKMENNTGNYNNKDFHL